MVVVVAAVVPVSGRVFFKKLWSVGQWVLVCSIIGNASYRVTRKMRRFGGCDSVGCGVAWLQVFDNTRSGSHHLNKSKFNLHELQLFVACCGYETLQLAIVVVFRIRNCIYIHPVIGCCGWLAQTSGLTSFRTISVLPGRRPTSAVSSWKLRWR